MEDKVDVKLTDTEIAKSYVVQSDVKQRTAVRLLKVRLTSPLYIAPISPLSNPDLYLRWLLQDARSASVNEYSEAIRARFDQMRVVPSYSKDDAKRLLRGDDRGVLEALTKKLELAKCPVERRKARESVARKPFLLFKKSLVETVAKEVRQAHRAAQTECHGRRLAFESDR